MGHLLQEDYGIQIVTTTGDFSWKNIKFQVLLPGKKKKKQLLNPLFHSVMNTASCKLYNFKLYIFFAWNIKAVTIHNLFHITVYRSPNRILIHSQNGKHPVLSE